MDINSIETTQALPPTHSPETASGGIAAQKQLSPEEEAKLAQMKQRDQEVRSHEQAHMRAAGSLATGGPDFDMETGPDNKPYAVGGNVEIDTSRVEGDPQKTIQKARQIQKAALAPADPSAKDRNVAAEARRMELEAQKELKKMEQEQNALYSPDGRQPMEVNSLINVFA